MELHLPSKESYGNKEDNDEANYGHRKEDYGVLPSFVNLCVEYVF